MAGFGVKFFDDQGKLNMHAVKYAGVTALFQGISLRVFQTRWAGCGLPQNFFLPFLGQSGLDIVGDSGVDELFHD